MRILAIVGLLLAAAMLVLPANPAYSACGETIDLQDAEQVCDYSPEEVSAMYANASSEGYRYRISPACAVGGAATCLEQARCTDPPGTVMFDVFRSPDSTPPTWALIGQTCLTEAQAGDLGALTPGMVLRAFRSLTWPRPELSVQPPDGETLVNFDTNFFTTLTRPQTQTVTLLGIGVEIEATPRRYVWHFGDGSQETTSTPGSAYPDLDVTHAYQRAGELAAQVDVVYGGRYRVGGGGWTDIPGTLTVPGPAVSLNVLEARPQLVG